MAQEQRQNAPDGDPGKGLTENLIIKLDAGLHRLVEIECTKRGINVNDMVVELLAAEVGQSAKTIVYLDDGE